MGQGKAVLQSQSERSGKPSSRVKANQGAAGVDGQSIAEFEANLSANLYKLESPVLRELLSSAGAPRRDSESEWRDAAVRAFGPTVADRIAQEVVRRA